ncbi:type II toxin-antitoxin system prevent-host-death family antitoxin [Rubrivirga sp. S365]|uniref:Type II toxin-antitoxin system prevent-host-death family antitoxin n=1 Tax=Rubrivirga litoralis TaxID=3075598 RepID=A0ABU3BSB3_9BACT|nr:MULTISPECIES: type II toxin-antitoxin system prevent-host-death family antitoxin [unclassified Rubrivirga]MDT0632188.1 type II toxin-antitoxin system prevent-host-death family antitoxin [Rubrivirga sp. F394]MDT7856798.1 type II toxin-antitoxin system prevent-host-death family antitoxin [Rubrivirga sp. S365]
MSHVVSLHDLPPALRGLLNRVVREGGEVLVTDGERTVARVVAAERRPGLDAGRLRVSGDFDAPLPRDVLDGFEA